MNKVIVYTLPFVAALMYGQAVAAKQDETEGMAGMSGQARQTYLKTDKKAAQRPGQTIHVQPIAPIKGEKGESKATKGEETAGTAPASGK